MAASRCYISIALSIASLVLVSSCTVGPNYLKPAAPANAGYAPAAFAAATGSAPVQGGRAQRLVMERDIPFEWWQLFRSSALNAFVEQAFKTNPAIAAAQAALAQAQELVYAQRGFYFPTVAAVYQAERDKIAGNLNSSETPGVQANGQNLLPSLEDPRHTPHNAPLYYSFHTAQVTVGFVPDVLGVNRRQVESLATQADAQRFALEATYITLASNVVAAAIQEASVRGQIALTEQIIVEEQEALEILRDQLRLGFAMRVDVAAQEAALAQAKTTLPPLRKQLEQTRDLIRGLVGHLPNDVEETFTLEMLQLPPEVPLSLPAKLIEHRPDIRAAEAQLHSANAEVGVAVAAMLPQFSITGSAGGNAAQLPWMFRSGGPFWNLVGNVSQPVFQGGTLLHKSRAASAATQRAASQYQSTVLAAYQNVADTLHATLTDSDALTADVEAEHATQTTYELVRRQMEVGYVNYLALLAAETAYQQARLTRVQAEAARYGDTVAMFQALGGGWWNRKAVAAR